MVTVTWVGPYDSASNYELNLDFPRGVPVEVPDDCPALAQWRDQPDFWQVAGSSAPVEPEPAAEPAEGN